MLGLDHLTAPHDPAPARKPETASTPVPEAEPVRPIAPAPAPPAAQVAPPASSDAIGGVKRRSRTTSRVNAEAVGKVSLDSLTAELEARAVEQSEPAPSAPEPVPSAAPAEWAIVVPATPVPVAESELQEAEEADAEAEHDLTASENHDPHMFDPETIERAEEEFFRTSPVLSVQGRPIRRRLDAPEFDSPDAMEVAHLAEEAGRLGVPDALRPNARALLSDLARRLEHGDLDWLTVRASIQFAIDHPRLARRLLPVLLPYLERAA